MLSAEDGQIHLDFTVTLAILGDLGYTLASLLVNQNIIIVRMWRWERKCGIKDCLWDKVWVSSAFDMEFYMNVRNMESEPLLTVYS